MSEAKSALDGMTFDGFVALRETGLQGMITLRGNLDARPLKAALKTFGVAIPKQRAIVQAEDRAAAWMSPDELLLFCPYDEVSGALAALHVTLAGSHALAVDMSDARAMFELRGDRVREVMAKLAPVDFAPGIFEPGEFRRSRMAQVPAAFWMPDGETMRIVCFRSVAPYMFELLKTSALPGSEVGLFRTGA
ncbi:sarcosine oxidase subunit gamma [Pukyongiella litopenaei]|uniref:Sarcosine oxidase subunit gamma n=1 Tax=Pukyongiella litopenaei TaxID=2605946 RepID=A0A2S0MKH3_9RHOB|nr:sarcosine oxidase subunit gamma family protein [Pukyongiella litopenaei]AVO36385.1 sarcosine oxidase subunit gamma [Pukyongiella litopenaei]